jgi:hypothetical protein
MEGGEEVKILWSYSHSRFLDTRRNQEVVGEFVTIIFQLGTYRLNIAAKDNWALAYLWTNSGWRYLTGSEAGPRQELIDELLERAIKFIDGLTPGEF